MILFRGVEYPNKKECALAWGLTSQVVDHLSKKKGCTFEEALEMYIAGEIMSVDTHTAIVVHGEKMASIKDCALHYKVSESSLKTAIREKGMTPEEAIEWCKMEKPHKPNRANPTEFRGKKFATQKECAEFYKLSPNKVATRMMRTRETFIEAMEYLLTPVEQRKRKGKTVTFRGVTYRSQKECALAYGLKPLYVRSYSYDYLVSFEEAMEYYVSKQEKKESA